MTEFLGFKPVILYSDVVLWVIVLLIALYARYVCRNEALAAKWRRVFTSKTATAAAAVLSLFFAVAVTDSMHYRPMLESSAGQSVAYDTKTRSVLDSVILAGIAGRERSYSAPMAMREFDKTTAIIDGKPVRDYQPLVGAGVGFDEDKVYLKMMRKAEVGGIVGFGACILFWIFCVFAVMAAKRLPFKAAAKVAFAPDNIWRPAISVYLFALWLGGVLLFVWPHWHVCGTDATGNDVLFTAFKSIRTAVVIGSLATLATLPFAVSLGIAAGYFKGWVDDVIQYVYTTISSIPSVLLIAASVLLIQVFIDKNPQLYETGLERADVRLFLLALIIGLTGWAGLARLLRAETMKVSAMDFVSAAKAFGVNPFRIMARHVFPNVVHIVLIVTVLDFSGIVLYEAVLSYVGVGVDPVMDSFGSMINAAAGEMSRTPIIWWNLATSFVFMAALVLSANLFASGVRDAFDPKSERNK